LEADSKTRQKRREQEGLMDKVDARDKLDTGRANAPLVVPDGAEKIDTSHLTLNEVVSYIENRIKLRLARV
jgi:cytidylate kinase